MGVRVLPGLHAGVDQPIRGCVDAFVGHVLYLSTSSCIALCPFPLIPVSSSRLSTSRDAGLSVRKNRIAYLDLLSRILRFLVQALPVLLALQEELVRYPYPPLLRSAEGVPR